MTTPDREIVSKGLECCSKGDSADCDNCNYHGVMTDVPCESTLMRDALTLLKAQEARVMMLDELEDWDGAVFFEAFETDMYYALIETVEPTAGMDGEYVFVNVEPGKCYRRIWGGEHYGEIWRCWTSRPTDEQRRETPWPNESP